MLAGGELVAHETVWHGVASAPAAFAGVMSGANLGKALVAAHGADTTASLPAAWRTAARARELLPRALRGALAARLATETRVAVALGAAAGGEM